MLGVFAEFERGIIRERVNAGLARARQNGTKLGRRRVKPSVEATIRELRAKGDGILKIARTLGVGTSVVQRVVLDAYLWRTGRSTADRRRAIQISSMNHFVSVGGAGVQGNAPDYLRVIIPARSGLRHAWLGSIPLQLVNRPQLPLYLLEAFGTGRASGPLNCTHQRRPAGSSNGDDGNVRTERAIGSLPQAFIENRGQIAI